MIAGQSSTGFRRTEGTHRPPSPASKPTAPENMGHPTTELATEPGDAAFDEDVERTLAWQCLETVRKRVAPLTYQAFDLYVMKGGPPDEVAKFLGIDASAVYVAKSRVLSSARREYEKLRTQDREV